MPIPTRNKSFNGIKGDAEVRVLADSLKVIFASDGDTYNVKKDGWDRPSGVYNVTLNRTNDAIKYVAPVGRLEPYLVKFLEYASRVGKSETNPGVPEPRIKEGGWRQGNSGPYYEDAKPVASVRLVVVEKGAYKGLHIFYEVPYIFSQYPGTMTTMLEGTKGERARVEKFLEVTGISLLNDEIPWSGNVLPFLEPKQQAADRVFQVTLNEKGFVAKDGLTSIPAYLITPDLLGEEPVAPKKAKANGNGKAATKKAPAKKVAKVRSK